MPENCRHQIELSSINKQKKKQNYVADNLTDTLRFVERSYCIEKDN